MSVPTQGYDIVMPELAFLKKKWPLYFLGLKWPRHAQTLKVVLADEQVMGLVTFWALSYRQYDQGIAWENNPVNERNEEGMQQRLTYWGQAWDSKRVHILHDAAYENFRHPTEKECQEAEQKADNLTRVYGTLMR